MPTEGREIPTPPYAHVSRGTFLNPQSTTVKTSGISVSEKLRNLDLQAPGALGKLVTQLSQTGVSVQATNDRLIARLGRDVINIPLFDQSGRMFHGSSVYSTVGKMFMVTDKGTRATTLPEYVYNQALAATSLEGGRGGMSARAQFGALRSSLGQFFKTRSVFEKGSSQPVTRAVGEIARVFEPYFYQGRGLPNHLYHMQKRATFFVDPGSNIHGLAQTYQQALQELSGAPARKAKFQRGMMQKPGHDMATLYQNMMHARKQLYEAVGREMPDDYRLLGASQSGKWVFPQSGVIDVQVGTKLLGVGSKAMLPITMTSMTAGEQIPLGVFKPGIHHLAHASYMPIPERYKPPPIDMRTKGPGDSKIYRSMSGGRSYAIIQPDNFFDKMQFLRKTTGRAGTTGIPMDLLVPRDPKMREFLLGKSGAAISEDWGAHALSREHEYTRKVKIAPSGSNMPGLEAGEFELNTALKKRYLREIGILGQTNVGSATGVERVGGKRPFQVRLGPDGIIGLHLDDQGMYAGQDVSKRVVRARSATDLVIGAKYLEKTGELEFTLAGQRELRMADQLLVGEHGVRVGASRVGPIQAVDRRGRVQDFDIMADVPVAELKDGKLRFTTVSTGGGLPELKGPGDAARYHLQTIATRIDVRHKRGVRKHGISGLSLMDEFAEALESKVKWIQTPGRKKEPIIEGILQSKRTYGDAMDRFFANIRSRVGTDTAAKEIFEELTGLETLTLRDEFIEAQLQAQGRTLADPQTRRLFEQLRSKSGKVEAFGFRGVPIGMRDRFYELKSGKAANIKFKLMDLNLLETSMAAYSTAGGQKDLQKYGQLLNDMMYDRNQSTYDDLTKMTRAFHEAPKGVKITKAADFAALPEGLSSMKEIEVDKLRGSILVDKQGRRRTKGFYVQVAEPVSLLGEGLHRAPTKPSDVWYMPSPASMFRIDEVTGKVILGGGPVSATGNIQAQRAYMQLLEQSQASGDEALTAASIKGRLGAVYESMFEAATGKSGSTKQIRIQPTYGGQGRVGYLPKLGADQIGIPSSRIQSTLGDSLYKQYLDYKMKKSGAEPVHMMVRRHPVKADFQLRSMEVVEIGDLDIRTALRKGVRPGFEMPNINAEEMFYTSRPSQWLAQADLDGDVIEAFLLTDDAAGMSIEQKALARIMAQQKKTTARIERMLNNIQITEEFGELASAEYRRKAESLSDQLRHVLGSVGPEGTVTDAVAATGFEIASRHGALTPAGEVFFRSRAPIVDEVSKLLDRGKGNQEIYATLSKWSKEEMQAGNMRKIADVLLDPQVGGVQASELYGWTRNLVGYRLLEKAAHDSDLKAEAGFDFINRIQRAGADIAENPSLLQGGRDVDEVADLLMRMAGGEQALLSGADVKATKALALEQEALQSSQNLNAFFRRMAKVTLATEAFAAGSRFQSPVDFMFRTQASALGVDASSRDRIGSITGGPGISVGRFLNQDSAYVQAMDELVESVRSQHGASAERRLAGGNASYAAGLDGLEGATRMTAKESAQVGLNAAQKIAQSKFFKMGAIGIGALAGWEALKSIVSGGDPPVMNSPMSQAPLPPPPNLQRASDSTFDYNYLPQQNIARIERVEGQKTRLNVSGRADAPVDFRGLSSVVVGNFGFQPVQNGTFRDDRAGELSRRDADQYLRQRLNAAF